MGTEAAAPAPQFHQEDIHNWRPCGDEAGRLTIDLGAIAANWRHLSHLHPGARAGAVVKADAYGLGACAVAPALAAQGCRDFFVAHLAEALALRPCLPADAVIYVLNGLAPGSEALCVQSNVIPVLNTPEQARDWYTLSMNQSRALPAALQVDTDMSRLGLDVDEFDDVLSWPNFASQVEVRLLMSHLACADSPDVAANAGQIASFARLAARLPSVPRSLANSAGALFLPASACDVLRPGLVLYGVNPGTMGIPGLRPALRLEARVIQIRCIPAGRGVGYGFDYVATTPRRTATLSAGYADGWPRALSSRGAAWFRGKRLPILGRVSMDSCVVDVTDLPEGSIRPGDAVELIGPNQSVSEIAALLNTTSHEILTGLGRRFTRVYSNEAPAGGKEIVS